MPNTVLSPGWSGFTADWFTHRIPFWRKHVLPKLPEVVAWLEIGSYEGRSATWVMDNVLKHKDSSIVCIDPWGNDTVFHRFLENIRAAHKQLQETRGGVYGEPVVKWFRNFSQNVLPTLSKNHFDVVYVDGDHQGKSAITDAALAWPLLKPDGFMIFDDYRWDYKDLKDKATKLPACHGIDAFLHLWGSELELVHKDYQVIVKKK